MSSWYPILFTLSALLLAKRLHLTVRPARRSFGLALGLFLLAAAFEAVLFPLALENPTRMRAFRVLWGLTLTAGLYPLMLACVVTVFDDDETTSAEENRRGAVPRGRILQRRRKRRRSARGSKRRKPG